MALEECHSSRTGGETAGSRAREEGEVAERSGRASKLCAPPSCTVSDNVNGSTICDLEGL